MARQASRRKGVPTSNQRATISQLGYGEKVEGCAGGHSGLTTCPFGGRTGNSGSCRVSSQPFVSCMDGADGARFDAEAR